MTEEMQNTENTTCDAVMLPDEIKKFNWGAFFLTWIWGLGNNSYVTFFIFLVYGVAYIFNSLGLFLPVCLAFNIYCGIKGNEWAWKSKTWESTDYFNRIQKRWAIGGALFFVFMRILALLFIFSMAALIFYFIYPDGNIRKFEDWANASRKGVNHYIKYTVESTLYGTNMSNVTNSNELAHEIASGLNTKSLGNAVYVSSNGRFVLRVYKDGACTLEKKNCYVQLENTRNSRDKKNYMESFKYYIDENKKLIPAQEVRSRPPKI